MRTKRFLISLAVLFATAFECFGENIIELDTIQNLEDVLLQKKSSHNTDSPAWMDKVTRSSRPDEIACQAFERYWAGTELLGILNKEEAVPTDRPHFPIEKVKEVYKEAAIETVKAFVLVIETPPKEARPCGSSDLNLDFSRKLETTEWLLNIMRDANLALDDVNLTFDQLRTFLIDGVKIEVASLKKDLNSNDKSALIKDMLGKYDLKPEEAGLTAAEWQQVQQTLGVDSVWADETTNETPPAAPTDLRVQ